MAKKNKEKEEVKADINKVTQTEEIGFANPTGISLNRDNVKVEITEEDKEKFFKSFISDSPFEAEDSLFENKVKVAFRSITVEQNNDIWHQIREDEKAGLASNTESYLLMISIYRLAMSLISIDGTPYDSTEITKESFQESEDQPHRTYVKEKADKFKNWNTFKLSAFIRSFTEFENKLFQLEQSVTDPNFWKAAE